MFNCGGKVRAGSPISVLVNQPRRVVEERPLEGRVTRAA
jgi:hypothetical protein